jgi:hypothetical protein
VPSQLSRSAETSDPPQILFVSYFNLLRFEGLPLREAIMQGAGKRVRPMMMTALTADAGAVQLLRPARTAFRSRRRRPLPLTEFGPDPYINTKQVARHALMGEAEMSNPQDAEHGSAAPEHVSHGAASHATEARGFTAAEASALHEEDRVAAGHIVKLMVAIFLVGIVLYSIVALICARGS